MKVLLTGAKGQLAQELLFSFSPNMEIYSFSKKQIDITNEKQVHDMITTIKPNVIIHPAAMTNVDNCEQAPFQAYAINTHATYRLAKLSEEVGAKFIYISTDYVFSGEKKMPYQENDETLPINIYGKTKQKAEKWIAGMNHVSIIRTSWLFGNSGNNFAKKVIQKAKKEGRLQIVNDQFGSPTYIPDLAKGIIALIEQESGIYHLTNEGACSWFSFARAIVSEMGIDAEVRAIASDDYPALAKRPRYSVLCNTHAKMKGICLPPWEQAVKRFAMKELER